MDTNIKLSRNNVEFQEINNKKVIVKKLTGDTSDEERRFNNILKWEFLNKKQDIAHSPRIISSDKEKKIVVHEWLENTESVQDYINSAEPEDIQIVINKIAKVIAAINSIPEDKVNPEPIIKQGSMPVVALTMEQYINSSGAELELYKLFQNDNELIQSLLSRTERLETATQHGDLRLDQFLIDNKGDIWIIDFEEFSSRDKYLDITGILGSIIFDALYKTFSFSSKDAVDDEEINDQIMKRGTENLANVKPIMLSALNIYSSNVPYNVDIDEIVRHLGLFLMERVISRSKLSYRLSDMDKAIAGVARSILINPKIFNDLY